MGEEEDKLAKEEAEKKKKAEQERLDLEQKANAAAKKKEEEGKDKDKDKPENKGLISEAKETVAALMIENDRHKALMKKQEEVNAEALLNGQSQATPQTTKEETPAEYAKKVMSGEIETKDT